MRRMDLQHANEAAPPGPSTITPARIALGCGNFGGVGSAPAFFGQGMDEDQALELMDAAWELGIRHFDTADAYGGGRSERAIGRWIATRGVQPTLTTKTFNPMSEGGDSGLAPARIARQLGDSLERLGVDRVELYLAHEFDPETPVAEWTEALHEHQRAGRIGAYGVSNFDAEQLTQALAAGDPIAIQNEYSLLRRGDEAAVLPLCAERHVAYGVYSPLCGGWLTGKYGRGRPYPAGSRMTQRPEPYAELAAEATFAKLDVLGQFAEERGTSMAAVALAWLLGDERIAQIVIGPGRPEHLQPVADAVEQPLTVDQRERLGEVFG
jgi:aryl-alcohol dehydrogenase-like predicted oxidoreductase